MMGSTYNGQYEPVEEVDRALEEIKKVGCSRRGGSRLSNPSGSLP